MFPEQSSSKERIIERSEMNRSLEYLINWDRRHPRFIGRNPKHRSDLNRRIVVDSLSAWYIDQFFPLLPPLSPPALSTMDLVTTISTLMT